MGSPHSRWSLLSALLQSPMWPQTGAILIIMPLDLTARHRIAESGTHLNSSNAVSQSLALLQPGAFPIHIPKPLFAGSQAFI